MKEWDHSIAILHTHTNKSDGLVTPTELISAAAEAEQKLERKIVLAITDHDTMAGVEEAIKAGEHFGIEVIPGEEVTTGNIYRQKHLLALGITTPLPSGLSVEQAIERIKKQNGRVVIAHPSATNIGIASLNKNEMKKLSTEFEFDGIEIYSRGRGRKAEELKALNADLNHKLGSEIGGTDSHFGKKDLLASFSYFPGKSIEDLFIAMRNKQTTVAHGGKSAITPGLFLKQQYQSLFIVGAKRYILRNLTEKI